MLTPHNPEVHTFDNRRAEIDRIVATNPDAIFVGSVARGAILGCEVPTLKDGLYVRDIDVTETQNEGIGISDGKAPGPFPLDLVFSKRIVVDGDTAHVRYDQARPDVSVELPSEVFDAYPATLSGMPLRTFHPDTLLNLHRIIGTYNPRVLANLRTFKKGLQDHSHAKISPSAFEPLTELQRMVNKDPELRKQKASEQIAAIYACYAPPHLRRILHPIARRAVKHLINETRLGLVATSD